MSPMASTIQSVLRDPRLSDAFRGKLRRATESGDVFDFVAISREQRQTLFLHEAQARHEVARGVWRHLMHPALFHDANETCALIVLGAMPEAGILDLRAVSIHPDREPYAVEAKLNACDGNIRVINASAATPYADGVERFQPDTLAVVASRAFFAFAGSVDLTKETSQSERSGPVKHWRRSHERQHPTAGKITVRGSMVGTKIQRGH